MNGVKLGPMGYLFMHVKKKFKKRIYIIISTPNNIRLTHVGVEGVTNIVHKIGQLTAVILID